MKYIKEENKLIKEKIKKFITRICINAYNFSKKDLKEIKKLKENLKRFNNLSFQNNLSPKSLKLNNS